MPRRVDEVQDIALPIVRRIFQSNRPRLDGDAPLSLQLHVVENLVLHLPGFHRLAFLQQPVRQGRLSVVNMGNDRKIPQFIQIGHTMHLKRLWERFHIFLFENGNTPPIYLNYYMGFPWVCKDISGEKSTDPARLACIRRLCRYEITKRRKFAFFAKTYMKSEFFTCIFYGLELQW